MLSDSVRVFIGDCIDGSLSVDKMRSPVPRPNASDKPGIALGLRPREELVIIRRQKSAFAKCERGRWLVLVFSANSADFLCRLCVQDVLIFQARDSNAG